jgi:Protein of unknown function (DUF1326)
VKIFAFFGVLLGALPVIYSAELVGEFAELHSCDLYTGGCTASSESTLLGRQIVQVWSIEQGTWNNQDLAGLKAAVLAIGSTNLAEARSIPEKAEIFVPRGLGPAQRQALLAWVRSQRTLPDSAQVVQTEITFQRTGRGADISVGDFISLSTETIGHCASGACGQALWYTPSAKYSSFEVVASRISKVQDPWLTILWTDHNRPNVFLARFGPEKTPRLTDLSGH